MGDKDRDLAKMFTQGPGDLQGRENQTARGVQDEIDRYFGIGELDGPNNLFGIIDINITEDRNPRSAMVS
jgi:hypothetical protein